MSTASVSEAVARFRPSPRELLVGALLLNLQGMAVVLYLATQPVAITEWRFVVYGFLWINVGILAAVKTDLPAVDARTRRIGLVAAGGYLLALSIAGGVVSPTGGGPLAELLGLGGGTAIDPTGLSVRMLPPGWGPAVVYQGAALTVVLVPYKVVGYLALAYLVYATVVDAAASSIGGLLGVFTCVSCVWPAFGGIVTSVFGGGSAIAAAATSWPYDVSTVAFLLAVGLLYWRPVGRG